MRRKYFQTNASKITFLLDMVAVVVSLFVALGVRSQFEDYYFAFVTAAALFPITLFLRALTLFLFDSYTLSFATLTNADIQRTMQVNLLPSAILLVLRVFSPISVLRMPYSMIVMEYIATTFGFILIRLVMRNRLIGRSEEVGYRRRVLLWTEVADIPSVLPDLDSFCGTWRVEIMGILNANPLFWQTEYRGIRVYGDESALQDILAADDRIGMLVFLAPDELTRTRLGRLVPVIESLNMDVGVIRGGKLARVSLLELEAIAADGNRG